MIGLRRGSVEEGVWRQRKRFAADEPSTGQLFAEGIQMAIGRVRDEILRSRMVGI